MLRKVAYRYTNTTAVIASGSGSLNLADGSQKALTIVGASGVDEVAAALVLAVNNASPTCNGKPVKALSSGPDIFIIAVHDNPAQNSGGCAFGANGVLAGNVTPMCSGYGLGEVTMVLTLEDPLLFSYEIDPTIGLVTRNQAAGFAVALAGAALAVR